MDDYLSVPLYVFYFSGEVVLYNIFYEVFTVCTSIVAETPEGNFDMNRTVMLKTAILAQYIHVVQEQNRGLQDHFYYDSYSPINPNPNQPIIHFFVYIYRQAFPRTKSGFWSFSWVKLHTLAFCIATVWEVV